LSSDEERMNELIVESRLLESTYNELASRQNMLERLLLESRASLATIKEMSSANASEVLVPVGAGILLRASPPKVDKVLAGIGADIVVEKSREDAEKMLEGRAKEIEESLVTVFSQKTQIAQRLEVDRRALQALVDRSQGQQQ
jgi:prefoldin alpha subunit